LATISQRNLPSAAAFHLIAEAPHGKITNDFDERDERRAEEMSKVDKLVHDGGEIRNPESRI
jgi:hypothetical protein